jgi:hypothetical protein
MFRGNLRICNFKNRNADSVGKWSHFNSILNWIILKVTIPIIFVARDDPSDFLIGEDDRSTHIHGR